MVSNSRVQVQILDDEPLDNIERVEPYGFSYRPKPGSQAYIVFPSGDHSFGMAIVVGDTRYQMELQEGEVALHDDSGNYILMKRGGVIHAKSSSKVFAETPLFECSNNALIGGNLLVKGQSTSDGGFFGKDGGMAECHSGLDVKGQFKVNGKNCSETHTHITTTSGQATSGVL